MINDSMNYKRITIFAKDTQNDMKRFIGHTILILLAEIFLFCPITMSQNNPYKINDQLYSYYQKCNSAIRKPEVLLMADTLFHMAKKKRRRKSAMPCPEPEIRPLLLYQRYQYIAHRERKGSRLCTQYSL